MSRILCIASVRVLLLATAILFPFGPHEASAAEPQPLVLLADRDYPPTTYLEGGVAKGMEVDLGHALASRMNREIKIELMDWNLAQEKVLKGEADGLIGLSITEERKALYDFAMPMYTREFGLLVRNEEMTIHGVDDLKSRAVGVTAGGFPRHFMEKQPGVTIVIIDNYEDGFDQLTAGKIDAIAADLWVAAYLMEKHSVSGIAIVGKPFATAQASIAVKKGNTALLEEINQTIKAMQANGTIAEIRKQWRPQEMLFVSRERFREMIAKWLAVFLSMLFGGMALWIFTLKKHIRIRKKAETALRKSDERLRAMIENTPNVAIQFYDRDGRVLYWNRASQKVYGWSAAEAVGKTLDQLIYTPQQAERFVAILREIEKTNQPFGPDETRTRHRDGSEGYCLSTIFSYPSPRGDEAYGCMDLDLADLKKANEALRESEARLQTLADASFEGVAVCEDGIVVDANDQLVKLHGYGSRAEMIGKNVMDLVAPESREFVRSLIASGWGEPYEQTALRKDGTVFPIEVHGRTISNSPHHVRVAAVRDMTARKQAEKALRESEAEHAAALQREQQALEHYARQLIASQEAERRRIAGELHDSLGQNLLLVKNRVQMALSPDETQTDVHEQLEGIRVATVQALAEVRQIAHALHPYQLDHLGLTRALEAMIESTAQSTDIVFQRKLDNVDEVFSREDATNLYRVVQECLNNIMKHAEAQLVRIELERDVRDVRLLVKDNGRGFQLKQYLPDSLSVGMGLKNIDERVRMLNGTMKITTSPGAGTAVEVVIPIPGEL